MTFKPYKLLLAVSVPGLLLALVAAGLLFTSGDEIPEKKPAPKFTLELLDGGEFQMSSHKGKPVMLNFFASWCHPCRVESPELVSVRGEYEAKGVSFLAIAIDDTEEDVKKFIEKLGFSFPIGIDKTGEIKDAFGVYGLPTTYFIGKKGLINYTHSGSATKELLRHELDKLL
ncbi:MAG: TlpA disulfide reductase family protein [Mariprofundaceae bacterium]